MDLSPRYWSRERIDALESSDARRSFSTCRKSAASGVSAATSAWASAATRTLAHADRSNPRRNLESSVSTATALATAKNNVRFVDRFVNSDPKTKPRMPRVQQFPKLGSVGVLKLCCTTRFTRSRLSDIVHLASSSQFAEIPDRVRPSGGYNNTRINERIPEHNAGRRLPILSFEDGTDHHIVRASSKQIRRLPWF
jgi:hypothetical protein